ncbi:flagellar biosynthesis protein FliR [Stieleria maiorica]|uniref:Flagellar biosynthesis protein FliR n=1 Tax=Stieleria maiorica TaxID=2795974 RepID=A0A5B9MEL3_9BACT|nr:flagellar biosynthetic protein FliR [Stieleria maiorica]QEF97627.1 flagellar biosynthesis protein FliR [Stieleria maiorica]
MISDVVLFLLVLARVSVFIAFFPLFSKKQLPNQVKAGLAVALSVFWLADARNVLPNLTLQDVGSLLFLFLVFKEICIGIMLALVLGLFFWPARIAGSYIAQELGLSLAAISDPGSQDSSTLVSRVLEAFSMLLFFSLNLHHFVILAIHLSFNQTMTRVGLIDLPTEDLVAAFNRTSDYGLLIVAPLLVLLMLVTLVLAFLNRAAPAMNLFSVGMSIRVGFGGLLLFLFCPILFGAIEIYFYRVQEDIEYLMLSLTG